MALINLRNALMTGKKLPYDAEVEFLESTGTQYINTGILPANNMSFDCAMMFTELTSADHAVLDSRSSGGTRFQMAHTYANKWTVAIGGSYDANGSAVSTNTFYQLHGEASNGQTLTLFANGSQAATLTTTGGISTIPIYVLARNLGAHVDAYSKARIYSLKIYVNGVLVRDFIPVRKGTVGYLYDRVSGKLFGNAGTGDFVLGPDVVPVEYILQTGTQYIDTLYPMADTRREVVTVDWSGHSTTYREFMAGAASGSYLIELSANGYYGTAPTNLSSIQVSQKDRIRWDYTVGSAPSLYINDVFAINDTLVRVPTGNVMTGGIGTSGVNYPKMKIYSLDVYTDNSVQVRKMLPVRVGTEGAMMDVLTRCIYRNAGTGAFTYGNDLK